MEVSTLNNTQGPFKDTLEMAELQMGKGRGPVVLLLLAIFLFILFLENFTFSFHAISVLALVVISAWPLIRCYLQRGDLCEPIVFLSLLSFMYYGARAIILRSDPALIALAPNLSYQDAMLLWNRASLYALAGLTAMQLGYFTPTGTWLARKIPTLNGHWTNPHIVKVSLVFVALGLFTRLFLYDDLTRILGIEGALPFSDLMMHFVFFAFYGLGLLTLYAFTDRPQDPWLKKVILLIVLLGVALFAYLESKEMAIRFLFIPVIALHYVAQRLSFKRAAFYLLILFFLVFPFIESYRQILWENKYRDVWSEKNRMDALIEVPEFVQTRSLITMAPLEEKYLLDYLVEPLYLVSRRTHGLDSLIVAMKMTPEIIPFKHRSLLFTFPVVSFIPRFLWPDKPILVSGRTFGTEYWGLPEDREEGAIAITQLAEFYIDFGFLGIVIGMFLVGILYRMIYAWFIRDINPSSIFIYIFALACMATTIERDVESTYTLFVKQLFFMVPILYWVTGKKLFNSPAPAKPDAG